MIVLSTMRTTTKVAAVRELVHNEAGNSVLEYGLVLALAAFGITAMLGGSAGFSNSFVQSLISAVRNVWPA